MKQQKFMAKLMLAAMLHQVLLAPLSASAQIVKNAGSGNTAVSNAPSGVPVVDIATPNAAGVSHNKFDQFNVDPKGVVLNNGNGDQLQRKSQLAGQVFANFNLHAEAALILNEVVTPNRSSLNGYIEVLGGKADVIVANPWGITCNGCGFLNTARATLTTGTPQWTASGALSGFRVGGGDILVNGAGLDASKTTLFDVLARNVRLDGQINARELVIGSGAFSYDYAARSIQAAPDAASGAVPAFAIDSSALGGMYADRIKLVATEAGVGVRMLGDAAANAGEFSLDAAGKVTLQNNRISAKQNLSLKAGGNVFDFSGTNFSLSAGADLSLNGGALQLVDGFIKAERDLSVNVASVSDTSAAAGNQANRFAGRTLNVNSTGEGSFRNSTWGSGAAASLNLGGGLNLDTAYWYAGADNAAAQRSLSISAANGMQLNGAKLDAGTDLSLSSQTAALNLGTGKLAALGAVKLDAAQNGILHAAGGTLQSGADLTAAGGNLNLDGQWQAGGNVRLQNNLSGSNLQVQQRGNLSAAGSISAQAVDWNNSGNVQGRGLDLQGAVLQNSGVMQSNAGLSLQFGSRIDNSGTLLTSSLAQGGSDGDVRLQTASLNNEKMISSAGMALVEARADVRNRATLQSVGDLRVNAGGNIENVGSQALLLSSAGQVSLDLPGKLSNEGRIQAAKLLRAGSNRQVSAGIVNQGTLLGNEVAAWSAQVNNSGTAQADAALSLNIGGDLLNQGAALLSAGTGLEVNSVGLKNAGTLQSQGDMKLVQSGSAENSGNVAALQNGNLVWQSANWTNSGKVSVAGRSDLRADSGAIHNKGVLQSSGNLQVYSAQTLLNQAGAGILGGAELNLSGGAGLTNEGEIGAASNLRLGSVGDPLGVIKNSGKAIGERLIVSGQSLHNSGLLQGNIGTSVNTSADLRNDVDALILAIEADKPLHINAANVANDGTIQSNGNVTLELSGVLVNGKDGIVNDKAQIVALGTGNIVINSNQVSNAGVVAADGNVSVLTQIGGAQRSGGPITGGQLNNLNTIQAGGNLALSMGSALYNAANARLLAGNTLALSSNADSFTVNNLGAIQAGGSLTAGEGAHPVASLVNSGSALLAANSIAWRGGAINNSAQMQAVGNLDLNLSGALLNTGAILSAGNAALLSLQAESVNNSGTLQAAGSLQASVQNTLGNSGKILTTGSAAAGVDAAAINNSGSIATSADLTLRALGSDVDNTGLIQAQGNANLSAAQQVNNAAAANILATGNLSLGSSNASFQMTNAGVVQAGSALTVGQSGQRVNLNNQSGAKLAGNTLAMTAGTLDNSGRIQAAQGSVVAADSFSNHGASAVLLTATDNTASSISLSGNLSNEGAIHGGGNLSLIAANIDNTNTAGISSLGTLGINTSGNLSNAGALYAGTALNVSSGGTLTNSATLSAPQGTMDSGGDITLAAATFVNNSNINATGNISITAATLRNETPGGDTREWYRSFDGSNTNYHNNSYYTFPDQYEVNYWEKRWTMSQRYAAGTPAFKPQIIGNGTLTLQGFNTATNLGGVISAPSITLSGNGGATFTNNDLALNQEQWRHSWEYFTHYIALGPAKYTDHQLRNDATVLQSTAQIFSLGAGIFAGTLNAGGFTLVNAGSPFAAGPNATGANPVGATGTGTVNATGAGNLVGTASPRKAPAANAAGVALPGAQSGAKPVAAGTVIHLPGASGLSLTLPANPNGFFVISKDPNGQFLVQANPLFGVVANSVGSDYLAQRLGFNTNTIEKRLGDANYEAYLVRQQLIAQTGSNVLKGYRDEAQQIRALMDNAATQASTLGLQFGQAPTPEQLAKLNRDLVWMVETEVAGQKVLAPVVYLAASTQAGIVSGAVIAANDISFDGDALENSGGSIIAQNSLNLKVKGDVKNLSGTLSGADVKIKAGGSITNETVAQTAGDTFHAATTIGKTAGIVAQKDLSLDAGKDITVKGAQVKAGGNADLNAKGNITFDTIENRQSTQSFTASGNALGVSSSVTRTGTSKNIGSNLETGGNLKINSGKTVTIAGSSTNVGGNLDLQAKDGVQIIARQDKTETHKEERASGIGVGGGLFGNTEKITDTFDGRNKAATLNVKGNANIKTEGDLTLRGSDLNVAGSANLDAAAINVLAGLDEHRSKTVEKTTSILSGITGSAGSSTSTKTEAGADAKSRTAKAGGSAEAEARADGEVKLFSTKTTTTDTLDMRSRGSAINVGQNLSMKAKNDITLEGANVEAKGNVKLDAQSVNVLAAQNISQTTSHSEEHAIKLSSANKASASASAGAEANGVKLSAEAKAQARAKASTDNVIGYTNVKTDSFSKDVTHTGSLIKSGGDLAVNAKDTLTLQGSSLDAGGDVDLKAKDIKTLAARDSHFSTASSETTTVGIYVGAEAQAGAQAQASAKLTGVGVSASADADAEAGTGLHISHEKTRDTSGSTVAQVSQIKAGGNLRREAENKITDVGTQITVGGNLSQKAKEIESLAAQNSAFSDSESDKHTFRIGVYGNAGASAGAEAKANVGGAKAGANAEAHAVGGLKVGYQENFKSSGQSATQAVVSNIVVGGNIDSASSGKTTIEASNIIARGDVKLSASELDFKAVQDTSTVRNESRDVDASLKIGAGVAASAGTEGGAKVGPQGELKIGVQVDTAKANANQSGAVTGSITGGGNVQLSTTQGDLRLQGVDVAAGKDLKLDAKGNVIVDAAQSTASSTSEANSVGVNFGLKAGGGSNEFSAGVNVGVERGNSASSTAKAGSLKAGGNLGVNAGKDLTLVGTGVEAAGNVDVKAAGNVNLRAAQSSSYDNSTKVDVGVGVSGSASGGSGSLDLDVALKNKNSISSQAVAIKSGGKSSVNAGADINQDGNVIAGSQATAGGKVNTGALVNVNNESDIRFGISVDVEAEKKKKKDKDGKEIEEPAKPKDKLNQFLDRLTGFDKPATPPSPITDAGNKDGANVPAEKPVQIADASGKDGEDAAANPKATPGSKQRQTDAGDTPAAPKPATVQLDPSKVPRPFAGKLVTEPDTAYFWSGRILDSDGNKVDTMNYARSMATGNGKGGTTLEATLDKNGVQMPQYGKGNTPEEIAASKVAWEEASAEYAKNVKGNVRALLGDVRPDAIWTTKELPNLITNPNVGKVIRVDPATGKESVLFDPARDLPKDPVTGQPKRLSQDEAQARAREIMNQVAKDFPQQSVPAQAP